MVFLQNESLFHINSKLKELWKYSKVDPPSCSQASPPRFSGFSNPSAAANPAYSLSNYSFSVSSSLFFYLSTQANWIPVADADAVNTQFPPLDSLFFVSLAKQLLASCLS